VVFGYILLPHTDKPINRNLPRSMGFSANLEFNASAEIADSVNYPNLRFWTSAQVPGATPQTDLKNIQAGLDPAVAGPYVKFSATSSFFGTGSLPVLLFSPCSHRVFRAMVLAMSC